MNRIDEIVKSSLNKINRINENIIDINQFNTDYRPKQIYLRDELKEVSDKLAGYITMNIIDHICIIGSRGSGKTISITHLLNSFKNTCPELDIVYLNARFCPTSYKLYQTILNIDKRGFSITDLMNKSIKHISKHKTILVIDEIDFLKDSEILYRISRGVKCELILLTQKTYWYKELDESIRSSLQATNIFFKDYDPSEIYQILILRAKEGLRNYDDSAIHLISGLVLRDYGSDIRVGIKALLSIGIKNVWNKKTIHKSLKEASEEVEGELISNLKDKELIILFSVLNLKDTNKAYSNASKLLKKFLFGTEITKTHFFRILAHLQNIGVITLIKKRVGRYYTTEVIGLIDENLVKIEIEKRLEVEFLLK